MSLRVADTTEEQGEEECGGVFEVKTKTRLNLKSLIQDAGVGHPLARNVHAPAPSGPVERWCSFPVSQSCRLHAGGFVSLRWVMRRSLCAERMALPVFIEKALANEEEQLLGKMSPHSARVISLQLPLLEAVSHVTPLCRWQTTLPHTVHCIDVNYDALIVHFV